MDLESAYIYQAEDKLPASDIVMILGASVYSDKNLTPVLRDRAVTALDLYRQGKVKKFLVTGDHTDRYYDEVGPVKEFLLKNGVPERDIHLDDSGIDTYNSMYRAKHIFEVRSMVVVTQNFHLSRAVYLARAVGIELTVCRLIGDLILLKTVSENFLPTSRPFLK